MSETKVPTRNGKVISLSLNEKVIDQIEIIKEATGMITTSEVIRYAVYELYNKVKTPAYVEAMQERRSRNTPKTIEERAEEQVTMTEARKDAQKKRVYERGMGIAEQMYNTRIVEHGNGFYSLAYDEYERVGARILMGEMQIPFENLPDDLPSKQFKGDTKEVILEMYANNNR